MSRAKRSQIVFSIIFWAFWLVSVTLCLYLLSGCGSYEAPGRTWDYRTTDLQPELGFNDPSWIPEQGAPYCGDHVCSKPYETILNCKVDCLLPAEPEDNSWYGHPNPGFVDPPRQ